MQEQWIDEIALFGTCMHGVSYNFVFRLSNYFLSSLWLRKAYMYVHVSGMRSVKQKYDKSGLWTLEIDVFNAFDQYFKPQTTCTVKVDIIICFTLCNIHLFAKARITLWVFIKNSCFWGIQI